MDLSYKILKIARKGLVTMEMQEKGLSSSQLSEKRQSFLFVTLQLRNFNDFINFRLHCFIMYIVYCIAYTFCYILVLRFFIAFKLPHSFYIALLLYCDSNWNPSFHLCYSSYVRQIL